MTTVSGKDYNWKVDTIDQFLSKGVENVGVANVHELITRIWQRCRKKIKKDSIEQIKLNLENNDFYGSAFSEVKSCIMNITKTLINKEDLDKIFKQAELFKAEFHTKKQRLKEIRGDKAYLNIKQQTFTEFFRNELKPVLPHTFGKGLSSYLLNRFSRAIYSLAGKYNVAIMVCISDRDVRALMQQNGYIPKIKLNTNATVKFSLFNKKNGDPRDYFLVAHQVHSRAKSVDTLLRLAYGCRYFSRNKKFPTNNISVYDGRRLGSREIERFYSNNLNRVKADRIIAVIGASRTPLEILGCLDRAIERRRDGHRFRVVTLNKINDKTIALVTVRMPNGELASLVTDCLLKTGKCNTLVMVGAGGRAIS